MKRLTGCLALAMLAPLFAACSHSSDKAPSPSTDLGSLLPADHFLQFLNHQPSLAAGDYTLVAATAVAAQSGSYSLLVTFDDGSKQTFSGNWTSSGGQDPTAAGNPAQAITLSVPGGLQAKLSSSSADSYLYLLNSAGNVLAQDDNSGGGSDALISLAKSKTNSLAYVRAYYATLDHSVTRSTFPDWKAANGINAATPEINVTFRDDVDLGYGRDIHFILYDDCSFVAYVRNYQVTGVPGQNYGPLNLDAAVNHLEKYHIGTNAIEWGPAVGTGSGVPTATRVDPASCPDTSGYFARYYSFDPSAPYARRETINMDARGEKAMPVPCISCHGGRADPILPSGSFPRGGDTLAHLQPLKVDSFDFSTVAGYTRADLEPKLKAINQAIFDSYRPNVSPADGTGKWDSTIARAMITSWYGSVDASDTLQNSTFQDSYIPNASPNTWDSPSTGVAGTDSLYHDVFANDCRVCHLLRGTNNQDDIDFASYDKFLGYAPRIEDLVYDQGIMPLARITFDDLFTTSGRAEELASFIPGFNRFNSNGTLKTPGRPIANAGPDRTVPCPTILSGSASQLAERYEWTIQSMPTGANASLAAADTVRPTLTTDTNGVYVIRLRVAQAVGAWSDPSTVTITIDSTVTPPSQLTFETDIKPLMQSDCTTCHFAHVPSPGVPLPPVLYSDPGIGEDRDLYTDVRARVNLADPASSPLLLKPTDHHHAGGLRAGFDAAGDHSRYDVFLNWVLAGAREK